MECLFNTREHDNPTTFETNFIYWMGGDKIVVDPFVDIFINSD